ncbi:hypothetical protein EWM64_g1793 [Hericium alpestre]|uniref:Major facilitator superfamily (MFS) profile domain-containing protein n=1 Tax=Hericium alpestre TaxID=135208 RepID=A0A4Z0A7H2_9AGAM|nr:hypothetical protein EWM64_g1793 [Hericium alpestre]
MSRSSSLQKEFEAEKGGPGASDSIDSIDFLLYHEKGDGRLVVDPAEAKIEFGEHNASKLKLSPDGKVVLWPQPTDDPEDPQNWSDLRKTVQLIIVTLAAIVPDFDSGIGIAAIFALAKQYDTTTEVINNLTSNWSIFLVGWGGIFAVMLMRRYGRLPILFWTQVLGLGFLIGATFSPTLKTFAAFRCLNAFFSKRKALSPHARYEADMHFRRLYDRTVKPIPPRPTTGLRYRVETVIGITGAKMAHYRSSWNTVIWACFRLVWRPHFLGILVFEAMLFGFTIGINVTNAVFLGLPKPVGFGFSQFGIAGCYGTPIVGVLIGELMGRYLNDWIQNFCIRRNHGVFEPESRLWACYVAIPLYICGFVLLGASLQNQLSPGALIMGWGIAQVANMVGTTAVYAYCNDCFPRHQGEVSALVNLARTLGGFSVAYFQVPWATKNGAIQTFGCEAAIVAGLFVLIVPVVQWKGRALRERFALY